MNIAQAKENIKNTVALYLKKDDFGEYRIPVVRQRPVFLLGAPGIGKTAIMEQIASELGIALVSYSMTHHTRQSALGLPYIEHREYGGEKVAVSEYTMSEIIASIYQTMEESGLSEGILFLDEINCVSETLSPSMLQFLQYKVFGRHRVPDGWVIVTAGNPPEYNKSVREFDVVTLDRLKVMEVEADYPAWKMYAVDKGMHGAILGFLEMSKDSFYKMEMGQNGKNYVTARGWEDLSDLLYLYEEENLPVGLDLIGQYIRSAEISRDFEAYYALYGKYRRIYPVDQILSGNVPKELTMKASQAQLDEKYSLLSILTGTIREEMRACMEQFDVLKKMAEPLKAVLCQNHPLDEALERLADGQDKVLRAKQKAGNVSAKEKRAIKLMQAKYQQLLVCAKEAMGDVAKGETIAAGVSVGSVDGETKEGAAVKALYNAWFRNLGDVVEQKLARLHALFSFVETAYGAEGSEMLIVVTELTAGSESARFLSAFASEDYEKYSHLLSVDRQSKLREEILQAL